MTIFVVCALFFLLSPVSKPTEPSNFWETVKISLFPAWWARREFLLAQKQRLGITTKPLTWRGGPRLSSARPVGLICRFWSWWWPRGRPGPGRPRRWRRWTGSGRRAATGGCRRRSPSAWCHASTTGRWLGGQEQIVKGGSCKGIGGGHEGPWETLDVSAHSSTNRSSSAGAAEGLEWWAEEIATDDLLEILVLLVPVLGLDKMDEYLQPQHGGWVHCSSKASASWGLCCC